MSADPCKSCGHKCGLDVDSCLKITAAIQQIDPLAVERVFDVLALIVRREVEVIGFVDVTDVYFEYKSDGYWRCNVALRPRGDGDAEYEFYSLERDLLSSVRAALHDLSDWIRQARESGASKGSDEGVQS